MIVRLFDGSVNVLSLSAHFAQKFEGEPQLEGHPPVFGRSEAKRASWDQLQTSSAVAGDYHCDETKVNLLRQRYRLTHLPFATVEALLWSSYLVGMELPGKTALFFRCILDLPERSLEHWGTEGFQYDAETASLNQSLRQVKIRANLHNGSRKLAEAQFTAFSRDSLPVCEPDEDQNWPADPTLLTGKVALVVGASRGFGAATAIELARSGATVIVASRSAAEWTGDLDEKIGKRIEPVQVDASDHVALTAIRENVKSKHGKLDFLICNAFPPIPSLRLESNAFDRLKSYLSCSLDLTLAPMCVFLEILNASGGTLLVVSSSAVDSPVRDWPHYVAAKSAIESLARVAQLQFDEIRTLVFRPERMLTDMTNTPMGRVRAHTPNKVARFLVEQLASRAGTSRFEILEMTSESREWKPALV